METTVNSCMDDLVIRPDWRQYVIGHADVGLLVILSATAWMLADNRIASTVTMLLTVVCLAWLAMRITNMARTVYVITAEQIMYYHGVLSHTTDYMELYRVYDYRQTRSFLQQLAGLKTVVIMSSDRNISSLNMVGIPQKRDIVSLIRARVEMNKQYKHVYEIGNR